MSSNTDAILDQLNRTALLQILEQGILSVGDDIRICRALNGDPQDFLAKAGERLDDMYYALLELRKCEGIPQLVSVE